MPMMPPAGGSDVLSMMAGGNAASPDQARGDLEGVISTVRDLDQQVQQLAEQMPAAANEVQQIRKLLKQMILKAAQAAPAPNPSSDAVPTAGA